MVDMHAADARPRPVPADPNALAYASALLALIDARRDLELRQEAFLQSDTWRSPDDYAQDEQEAYNRAADALYVFVERRGSAGGC